MKSKPGKAYQRSQSAVLAARLAEPRRFIQVVAGPRQVGKSTLVQQVTACACAAGAAGQRRRADPAWRGLDRPAMGSSQAGHRRQEGAVLVLDEIQKIPGWSETVKRLWDEDTRAKRPLKVVLLGSAPLLIAQGLTTAWPGASRCCPVALVVCGNAGGLRLVTVDAICVLRRLSGRGAADWRARTLGALCG
jgi:hypothetical protein